MKFNKLALASAVAATLLTQPVMADTAMDVSNLPAEITAYLNQNFADSAVVEANKDDGFLDDIEYEVRLNDNTELTFNDQFELTKIDSSNGLPLSVLPASVADYVESSFDNVLVKEWEQDDNQQKIELINTVFLTINEQTADLENNVELELNENNEVTNMDGSIALPVGVLPAAIAEYVQSNFDQSLFKAWEFEDNEQTVELINGDEFSFNDQNEVISIESDRGLPLSVLPAALVDYIEPNYGNALVTEWELEDNEQTVELNNDLEFEFDAAGNFVSGNR